MGTMPIVTIITIGVVVIAAAADKKVSIHSPIYMGHICSKYQVLYKVSLTSSHSRSRSDFEVEEYSGLSSIHLIRYYLSITRLT